MVSYEPMKLSVTHRGDHLRQAKTHLPKVCFPPNPETFQRSFREAIARYWTPHKKSLLHSMILSLQRLIGDRDGYGCFRVTGMPGRYEKSQKRNGVENDCFVAIASGQTGKDKRVCVCLPRPLEKYIQQPYQKVDLYSLFEARGHGLEKTD